MEASNNSVRKIWVFNNYNKGCRIGENEKEIFLALFLLLQAQLTQKNTQYGMIN